MGSGDRRVAQRTQERRHVGVPAKDGGGL
jgi:hypothetical protein